ncbi:MAG: hypothetical protein ACOCZV_00810 [Nanoarchaeota archaeon]
MMKSKGQGSLEFVILVTFMLVVFFIFFTIIQDKMAFVSNQQDIESLKQINSVVLSEISIARSVDSDYYHNFSLPRNLGTEFSIGLYDSKELVSSFRDKEYVNFLPVNVTGEFNIYQTTKNNVLYKYDGIVVLDNGTIISSDSAYGYFLNVPAEQCFRYNKSETLGCDELNSDVRNRCAEYTGWC